MIRLKIMMGILDKNTEERLLGESQLSLKKAIGACRATETRQSQCKALQREVQVNVNRHSNYNRRVSSRPDSTYLLWLSCVHILCFQAAEKCKFSNIC